MSTYVQTKDIVAHLYQLSSAALEARGCAPPTRLEPPPNPNMGDWGFPCFPYARVLRTSPQNIAKSLEEAIRAEVGDDDPLIAEVRATGPYLNFKLDPTKVLACALAELAERGDAYGSGGWSEAERGPVLIEYSSPNTNKPQHLGHVRNDLLGESLASVLRHFGREVIRTNLINDRGVHICKSMLAYTRFGHGETPESSGVKGDHLVGQYYVLFGKKLAEEYAAWQQTEAATDAFKAWAQTREGAGLLAAKAKEAHKAGELPEGASLPEADARAHFFKQHKDDWYNTASALGLETRAMLRAWEEGDAEIHALWRKLNGWVEAGFDATYARLGIAFDRVDHESETYLLGKDLVEEGVERGVFHSADNGAIVFDLEKIGLSGEKAVLRPDGTSLYTTQDLGTAIKRFEAHNLDQLIYVVGDEQDHHFRVLFGILAALRPEIDGRCHHLSYGMISLPDGNMKSQKGNVVTADAFMDEMEAAGADSVRERDADLPDAEVQTRGAAIGQGALKFFMLNYAPRTSFMFDKREALKFEGQTGPYCMYAYARTASILRKADTPLPDGPPADLGALSALTTTLEHQLIRAITNLPQAIEWAANQRDPSKLTGYAFDLSKAIAAFFNDKDHNVLQSTGDQRAARLQLVYAANRVLGITLGLLGIPQMDVM